MFSVGPKFYITFATSLWTTTFAIMLGRFWLNLCDFLVIMGRLCWIKTGGWVLHLPQQGDLRGRFATWNVIAHDIFSTCKMFDVKVCRTLKWNDPTKVGGFILSTKMKNVWTASRKLLQRSLILKPSRTLTGSNSRYYQKIFVVSELCSEVAISVHYKLIDSSE